MYIDLSGEEVRVRSTHDAAVTVILLDLPSRSPAGIVGPHGLMQPSQYTREAGGEVQYFHLPGMGRYTARTDSRPDRHLIVEVDIEADRVALSPHREIRLIVDEVPYRIGAHSTFSILYKDHVGPVPGPQCVGLQTEPPDDTVFPSLWSRLEND